jgi:predicted Zn-dependent protease
VLDAPPTDDERSRIRARVIAAPRPASRVRPAVAATILAAAATIAFVMMRAADVPAPAAPDAPVAAVASVRTPTVFLADRPHIERPEPELTLRGTSTPVPDAEQIARGLDSADDGRLQDALQQLTTLTRTDRASSDTHLALGALLLRAARTEEAVQELERAKQLAAPRTSEEVDWYLAVALARSGAPDRAARILEPLCGHSSMRGALACAGLAELDRRRRP